MKTINIKQVDAFTTTPLTGNPAGVVIDAATLNDDEKLKIAMEMNLSETAFVSPSEIADFKVQFFTPKFKLICVVMPLLVHLQHCMKRKCLI